MTNKEYFDTLRVVGVLDKENYNKSKILYLEQSDFNVDIIHRKLYLSNEFRFNYILALLCKWSNRFKSVDKFDMRIVDKIISVAQFRKNVMLYKDNNNFEKFLLQEDFIENKVDEVLRYISIFQVGDRLETLNLDGDTIDIVSNPWIETMSIKRKGSIEETYFIVYKDKKFKFINDFRKIKKDEYDFVITNFHNRRYIE